jgi:hypothetical protein
MKASDLDKAKELIRRHNDLLYYQSRLPKMHRAYITIQAPRSGPGNDRDELTMQVPLDTIEPFIKQAVKDIEKDLEELGVSL